MEILRVPPYPIVTTWDVPEADSPYVIYVEDVVDHSFETVEVTSDANSQITYTLPRSKVQFDRDFVFRVYDTDMFGEIVIDSNLTVYRPYVDPNILGTTASEVTEYKRLEIIARSIMDAYLGNDSATGEGFYNHKLILQTVGQGTDYIPMWHNPKKVLKVYENNILVYNGEDIEIGLLSVIIDEANNWTDIETRAPHYFEVGDTVTLKDPLSAKNYKVTHITSSTNFRVGTIDVGEPSTVQRYWESKYAISPDNSAIMKTYSSLYNRAEQSPIGLPRATGDLGPYGLGTPVTFPKGYDYVFILDVGYKAVPPDVEQAAMMLIDDIKCGRNEYYTKFITQYSTDQFNIKFAPEFLKGTGNLIVDKILDGYKGSVFKPGIL